MLFIADIGLKHLIWITIVSAMTLLFACIYDKKSKKMREESGIDYDELEKKYLKLDHRMRYILVSLSFLFAAIFTFLLFIMSKLFHSEGNQYIYVIPAGWEIWCIHGLLLGVLPSAPITDQIFQKSLGPERYEEFSLYLKLKNGTDGKMIFAVLAIAIIGISCVTIPLFIDCYVKVSENEIVIDELLTLQEKKYSFDDIHRFVMIKLKNKATAARRNYYEIYFNDGDVLSFEKSVCNPSWETHNAVIDYLIEKSGKRVFTRDPYPKK